MLTPEDRKRIEDVLQGYDVEPMTAAAEAWNHLVSHLEVPDHEAYALPLIDMCINVVKSYGRKKASMRSDEVHIKAWIDSVFDRQREVDPSFQRDWFDMAYGFFLARGLSPDDAFELSLEVEDRNLL